MSATWAAVVWNLCSALIGGFIGGMITAYSLGRWRGEIEQRTHDLLMWRESVDDRLDRGADRIVDVEVIKSQLLEGAKTMDLLRADLREGFKSLHERVSHNRSAADDRCAGNVAQLRKELVSRAECAVTHKRASGRP